MLFSCQGDGYAGLNAAPAHIGERELREIHIPAFEGAVASGCRSIMAAYNEIDGVLCHDNHWLLTTLARKEIGFDGVVMADGVALDRLAILSGSKEKAAARGLKAGVDLSLWDDVYTQVEAAVLKGYLDETVLDTAVLRILKEKEMSGLFNKENPNQIDIENSLEIIHQTSEETFVLIKNDNNLAPIPKHKKIALIGPNANSIYNQCGDYTPYKDTRIGSTILDGLKDTYDVFYAKGSEIVDTLVDGVETALEAAKKSDVIVVSLGGASTRDFETKFDANGAAISGSKNMTSGENIDLADISIPLAQVDLIKALATLNKPMVGLIIQGRVHAIDEIEDYFDTLFIAGFPGEHAGRAFGRILSGEVSPSGKMAMSVPGSKLHIPSFYNYKKSEQNENYVDHKLVSKYPFGYGLSYSNFKISDITYAYDEDVIIKGFIKNEGPFDASEVIQVYIRHESSSVIQRIKALKTFKKMYLKNNETKAFELVVFQDDLKVWTKDMTFEIEEGKTLIMVEATNFKFEFTIDKVGKPTW